MLASNYDALLNALAQIREELARYSPTPNELTRAQISFLLSEAAKLGPCAGADISEQILSYSSNKEFAKRIFFVTNGDHSVFAAFFILTGSLDPRFEYGVVKRLSVDDDIAARFSSHAAPVWLEHGSAGLLSPRIVALFPENWWSKTGNPPAEDELVVYFINRFVERFLKFSVPALIRGTAENSFTSVKQLLSRSELHGLASKLSVIWMWLHEHCHRLGNMPLPRYLAYKGTLSAGAVEEMRADVLAILELSHASWIPGEFAKLTMEFILGERILRYPIECVVRRVSLNYDAIGSQILMHYLLDFGSLSITDGVLKLSLNWIDGLESYASEIQCLEKRLVTCTPTEALRCYRDFARHWGGYDDSTSKFTINPFYTSLAERVVSV